jgi:hypothetical protein
MGNPQVVSGGVEVRTHGKASRHLDLWDSTVKGSFDSHADSHPNRYR